VSGNDVRHGIDGCFYSNGAIFLSSEFWRTSSQSVMRSSWCCVAHSITKPSSFGGSLPASIDKVLMAISIL
jgi:hypothetical protein